MPNLAIVFVTTLAQPHAFRHSGLAYLHFTPYSRAESIAILAARPPRIFDAPPDSAAYPEYTPELAAEDDAWLWNRYLGVVWDSLSKHAGRDLVRFELCAHRLWRDFVRPINEGVFGTRDFSRLLVNRRHVFQNDSALLDRVLPSTTASEAAAAKLPSHQASFPDGRSAPKPLAPAFTLPYFSTFLLIAAYLASHNPARTDSVYFMQHTDKRKNRRRRGGAAASAPATPSKSRSGLKSRRSIPRHLLMPSPFTLDRLLAIFRALLPQTNATVSQAGAAPDSVPQLADLYTQIATLTSIRLLVRAGASCSASGLGGHGDVLEPGAKWRVNFGWEWIRTEGRRVGVEVADFLVGGAE